MWRKRGINFSARLMQPEATSGSATGLPAQAVISKVTSAVKCRNIYSSGSE